GRRAGFADAVPARRPGGLPFRLQRRAYERASGLGDLGHGAYGRAPPQPELRSETFLLVALEGLRHASPCATYCRELHRHAVPPPRQPDRVGVDPALLNPRREP